MKAQRRPFRTWLVAVAILGWLAPANLDAGPKTKAATGAWAFTLTGPRGGVSKWSVSSSRTVRLLTGTFRGPMKRSAQIVDGTIEDGQISFTVQRQRPNGQGSITVHYQGELKGTRMEGTAEQDFGEGRKFTRKWTATRVR